MNKIKNITLAFIVATLSLSAITSQATEFTTYVQNSSDADITQYKSYAQLRQIASADVSVPFCGASIYSDTLIITAAHCLYSKKSEPTYVNDYKGDGILIPAVYELNDVNGFGVTVKNPTRYDVSISEVKKVKAIYVHPDFKHKDEQVGLLQSDITYDIAIIELETPIDLSDNVSSITLPSNRDYNNILSTFDLVGLGYNLRFEQPPTILQHSTAKFLTDDTCYGFEVDGTDELALCTESITEGGDSGGPLFFENENGVQVQVGIVNSGGILQSNFTELIHFTQWIDDVINNEGFTLGNPIVFNDSIADINGFHSYGDTGYVVAPTAPTAPTDPNTPDSDGSSGGSTGLFSIIGLGLVAFIRRKSIKIAK